MASKFTNFMQNTVYKWIFENIDIDSTLPFPEKKGFWVVPLEKSDPEYDLTVTTLLDKFNNTKIGKFRIIDGIGVVVIRDGERTVVCGAYLDGARKLLISDDLSEILKPTEITFLQRISVISKLGITANRKIDSRVWKNNPIFEADVAEYFPYVACFELDEDAARDPEDAILLRFLISIESGSSNVREFQEDLMEVMLSIPLIDHDWLVQQLLYSVLSGRNSSFYFELYRIAEFFFPLIKIEQLKESINYPGDVLKLLGVCMSELGWHVNHNTGSKLALNYASVSFAEIMLEKTYEGKTIDDERRFKESAMEKISTVRHSLVHQYFKQADPSELDIKRSTKSLLCFLSNSFSKYTNPPAK